jgi:hypothetical protein
VCGGGGNAGIGRGVLNLAPMVADCNLNAQDALSPGKEALNRGKWGSRFPVDKRQI